jgi:hypothetical protein
MNYPAAELRGILLINDLNRRYFDIMATFRFHRHYVNLLNL